MLDMAVIKQRLRAGLLAPADSRGYGDAVAAVRDWLVVRSHEERVHLPSAFMAVHAGGEVPLAVVEGVPIYPHDLDDDAPDIRTTLWARVVDAARTVTDNRREAVDFRLRGLEGAYQTYLASDRTFADHDRLTMHVDRVVVDYWRGLPAIDLVDGPVARTGRVVTPRYTFDIEQPGTPFPDGPFGPDGMAVPTGTIPTAAYCRHGTPAERFARLVVNAVDMLHREVAVNSFVSVVAPRLHVKHEAYMCELFAWSTVEIAAS